MTRNGILRRLLGARSGVAMTEFALGAPFLLAAGLGGTELANYALVNMQVSQLATHIADNASRIGDTSALVNRKIYESDINDVIVSAHVEAKSLRLYEFGRVFISSLQVDPETGYQHIAWQRCRGKPAVTSTYGVEGDGLDGKLDGIGPSERQVFAQDGDAVIFVEINYVYQPMISDKFVGNRDMHAIAAFTVRDRRDLSQIYQRDPGNPDQVQSCADNLATPEITSDGKVI